MSGAGWCRIPPWAGLAICDERSSKRGRAFVYLLSAWHIGNDPGPREVARMLGTGAGLTARLTAEAAEWARANGARLPERYIAATGTLAEHSERDATPAIDESRNASGTVHRGYRNDSRARALLSRGEEIRSEETESNSQPPAEPAFTDPEPTPDAERDPSPAPPSTPPTAAEPNAHRATADSAGNAQQGEPPAEPGGSLAGDPEPGQTAASVRPAVERRKRSTTADPADATAVLWTELDAIRRKNITGASACLLTAGRRKSLAARMEEHGADTLRAMVEWVTGCKCASSSCRACWLQANRHADADTYLRPDNCAKYIERMREARAPEPTTPTGAVDTRAQRDAAYTATLRALATGGDIDHPDSATKFLARRVLRDIGGRHAWAKRLATSEGRTAWADAWPAAVEAMAVAVRN